MNLNQRRPTGTHINHLSPVRTKADFYDTADELGAEITEERKDGWHDFYVNVSGNRELIGSFSKGERRDWQGMADELWRFHKHGN